MNADGVAPRPDRSSSEVRALGRLASFQSRVRKRRHRNSSWVLHETFLVRDFKSPGQVLNELWCRSSTWITWTPRGWGCRKPEVFIRKVSKSFFEGSGRNSAAFARINGPFSGLSDTAGWFCPTVPLKGYKMCCTSSRYVTLWPFITFCVHEECCSVLEMFEHTCNMFLTLLVTRFSISLQVSHFSKTCTSQFFINILPHCENSAGNDRIFRVRIRNSWRHNNERNYRSNQFSRIDLHSPHLTARIGTFHMRCRCRWGTWRFVTETRKCSRAFCKWDDEISRWRSRALSSKIGGFYGNKRKNVFNYFLHRLLVHFKVLTKSCLQVLTTVSFDWSFLQRHDTCVFIPISV